MREFAAVEFVVPGKPQGKGRPRGTTIAGQVRLYTPSKTKEYEALVAEVAQVAMRGRCLIESPVLIELQIYHEVPASWPKRKRAQALQGLLPATCLPDADNVLKAICDGCNGIVWKDDRLASDGNFRRRYAETPCVRVRIVPLMTEEAA